MRVLVTGANGFIGRRVVAQLISDHQVCAASRRAVVGVPDAVERVVAPDLAPDADWSRPLKGVDVVVHLAARVHIMKDRSRDPLREYRRVNVEGTLRLARQAAEGGARRFVFLSSIKVNGESTAIDRPFRPSDTPSPVDPYAISKAEAEVGLAELGHENGMEIVAIRPPLVYGPGVGANFLSMANWIKRGVPLPFGGLVENRRSLIALDNLVELVRICVSHPRAGNEVFLAGDGLDLSTADLVTRTAAALGVPTRLVHVPPFLVRTGLIAVGRRALWRRLGESLRVDASKARNLLGWNPVIDVDEGLRRAVAALA